jgi:hypothetical protein
VALDLHGIFPGALPPWASEPECFRDACGDVAVHVCVARLHSLMERAMKVLYSCQTISSHKDRLQFGLQAPLLSTDQLRSILPGVDGVHVHFQEGVADYYMQLLAQLNGSVLLRARRAESIADLSNDELMLDDFHGSAAPSRLPSPVLVAPSLQT